MDLAAYAKHKQKLDKIDAESFNKSRNILFIVRDLGLGGVSKVNLDVIRGIAGDGVEFHVATTSPAHNLWQDNFKPLLPEYNNSGKGNEQHSTVGRIFLQYHRKTQYSDSGSIKCIHGIPGFGIFKIKVPIT